MGCFLACELPQSLYSIEFRGICGQIVDFDPFSIFTEPIPNFAVPVVRRTILYVMNSSIFLEEFADRRLQENRVGLVIEDIVDHEIKLCGMKIHTAKHFH